MDETRTATEVEQARVRQLALIVHAVAWLVLAVLVAVSWWAVAVVVLAIVGASGAWALRMYSDLQALAAQRLAGESAARRVFDQARDPFAGSGP